MLKRTLPLAIVTLTLLVSGCHIWLRPAVVYSVGYYYPPLPPPPPFWWYDYWSYYYWSSPYWCFCHHWYGHHWVWVEVHHHYYEWWPDPPSRYKWGYWAGHKRYKRGRYAGEGRWKGGNWAKRSKNPASPFVHQVALPEAGKSPARTVDKPETVRRAAYVQRGPLSEQEMRALKGATSTPRLAGSSLNWQAQDRTPATTRSASGQGDLRGSSQPTDRQSETARITNESVAEYERPRKETGRLRDSTPPRSGSSSLVEVGRDVAPKSEQPVSQEKASEESPRSTPKYSGAVTNTRESAARNERLASDRNPARESLQSTTKRPQERTGISERSSFSQGGRSLGANPYGRSRMPKQTAGRTPRGRRR